MLENPGFAQTHGFREAFLASRAAGFLVYLPTSSEGPGSALVVPSAPLGQVLLVFELVEQADALVASYGEDTGMSVRVTIMDQVAMLTRRGDDDTPVRAFLVDRNAVLAPLHEDWAPTPVVERPALARSKKRRQRP